jgi:hypothetical protein
MALVDALTQVLTGPSASTLWSLRADLLEAGVPEEAPVWPVLDHFHAFLDRLATSTTSRDYSHLASKMDISAVGGVIAEHLLESDTPSDLATRFFTGLLSEGLMVLATRQHVKAWEGELAAVYRDAGWSLYGDLWRWTESQRPELDPGERRRLIDTLLAPLHSDQAGSHKTLLVGVLFQILLLARLREAVPDLLEPGA